MAVTPRTPTRDEDETNIDITDPPEPVTPQADETMEVGSTSPKGPPIVADNAFTPPPAPASATDEELQLQAGAGQPPTAPPPTTLADMIGASLGGATTPAAPTAPPAPGYVAPPTPGYTSPAGAGGALGGMANQIQSKLAELMGRSTTPSANDPEIAKALQANQLAGQRGEQRGRVALAEQMSRAGLSNSGAMEGGILGLGQARADQEARFAGDLFQKAGERRIAELQNTLNIAGNQMNAAEQNAIQREIAQMQNALGYANLGLGYANLNEGARQFGISSDIQREGIGASAGAANASLAQRAKEFDAEMGWNREKFGTETQLRKDEFSAGQNRNNVLDILDAYFSGRR